MLQVLGKMREDGERVHEVEARVLVGQRRRQTGDGDLDEREVVAAPFDHLRIDVAPQDVGSTETGPVAEHAATPAAPVQDRVEILDRRSVLPQEVTDEPGLDSAALEEDSCVG